MSETVNTNINDLDSEENSAPRLATPDRVRIAKLRNEASELMEKLVKENPGKYDPALLKNAKEELEQVKDNELDKYLVDGEHLKSITRDVSFADEEIVALREMFKEADATIDKEFHKLHKVKTRDDWNFVIKVNGSDLAVNIAKKYPEHRNIFPYILMGMSVSRMALDFQTMDDLIADIKRRIELVKAGKPTVAFETSN